MKKNRGQGFTLIEVMVVVAIVAIIASIAYPSYQESVRKTKRAEGRAALMQLMQQEERYYSQTTRYIAFSSSSTADDEKKFRWYSADSAASSSYEISAKACDDEVIQDCVMLTAKPGTEKVNAAYKDPACGNLTLSSTGVKGPKTPTYCWQ